MLTPCAGACLQVVKALPERRCLFRVCLPASLPACLPACLLVCLSACLPACLPACLTACLSACLPVCLSAYLSVCLSVCVCLCLPVCLPVCLSVWECLMSFSIGQEIMTGQKTTWLHQKQISGLAFHLICHRVFYRLAVVKRFKCRFVAWQRGLLRKFAGCVLS